MTDLRRRDLLVGTALVIVGEKVARGSVVSGHLPWAPVAESHPAPSTTDTWLFLTNTEAAMVEAIADRIIPPDPQTPGGKDAGCAVFIDRQLAGPYGKSYGLYTRPPFEKGEQNQGPQSAHTPADFYRTFLAAIDRYCRSQGGKSLGALPVERQDEILQGLENGSLQLEGVEPKVVFDTLVRDIQEGFFADPIYGGNRDMCAWKMIGFPGAHYDYREWVGRHNERVTLAPVGIGGRPDWTPKG